jgi:hypothetical protein
MWCCWISPDHNPASTQRSPRFEYRAARIFKAELQTTGNFYVDHHPRQVRVGAFDSHRLGEWSMILEAKQSAATIVT